MSESQNITKDAYQRITDTIVAAIEAGAGMMARAEQAAEMAEMAEMAGLVEVAS